MSKVTKKFIQFGTGSNDVNAQALPTTYSPSNYTPSQVASEGIDKTSAHFKGIDVALIGKEQVFNGLNNSALFSASYNATNRQLTITYTTGAVVYVNGIAYPKTGSETTTAHANTSGKYFFYYDNTGALTFGTTGYDLFNSAPVILVYYNSTLVSGISFNERHLGGANGTDMAIHDNLHNTRGTQVRSGGVASGYTLNTNGLANVSYAISAGSVDDESLVTATSAQLQGGANTYRILHLTGTSASPVWTWTDDAEGGLQSNGTDIYYNQLNAGTYQLTPITTNGNYVNYWGVLVPTLSEPQYVVAMGQNVYTSQANAEAASFSTDVANFGKFTEEGVVIYQFTYHRNGGFGAPGNSRLMSVTSTKQSVISVAVGSGTVTSVGLVDTNGIYSVSNSPITSAGTLALSLNSQSANTVLASPNGSSGSPSFRSLVAADLPTGNLTAGSSKISLGGTPNGSVIGSGVSVDLGTVNISDLSDVSLTTLNLSDRLGWNGSNWTNLPPSAVGAGSGITQFRASPTIISANSNNLYTVNTFSATPVTTAELAITSPATSNASSIISAWLGDVALRTSSVPAGIWEFNSYCSVSSTSGGRITNLTIQLYRVDSQDPLTFTTTGSGTSRTLTASGGSPFSSVTANSNIELCSYVMTPQGLYQITGFTSSTVVTIAVPSTYTNESSVSTSIWNPLFNVTTPTITSTGTNYTLINSKTTQPAFNVNTTTKLGTIDFANVTGASTTLTITYNDMIRNSNIIAPLVYNHNDLPGLQGGTSDQYYHLTNSQYTVATQAASASQNGYLSSTDWSTFNNKVTPSTGDIQETSFAASNNISSPANVTGFAFANASVRSFEALVSVYVGAGNGGLDVYKLLAINTGAGWAMSVETVSGQSPALGIAFSISGTGQVQYTSPNFTSWVFTTIKFRAITTSV